MEKNIETEHTQIEHSQAEHIQTEREQQINKIQDYLKIEFPNIKFLIEESEIDDNLVIIHFNPNRLSYYLDNISHLELLKNNIMKIISGNADDKCAVCFELFEIGSLCQKCSRSICSACFINIFRKNNGIVKCPFCRDSYGIRLSDEATDEYIQKYINENIKLL